VLLNLYVRLWPFIYEKSHSHVKAILALNNFVDATGQDPVETLARSCPIKEIQYISSFTFLSLLCSTRMHLFDQNHSNIVKLFQFKNAIYS